VKIKGISPVADHWRTKAEELERSLALKGLQVEEMREAIRRAVDDLDAFKTTWSLPTIERCVGDIRERLKQSLNTKNEEGKGKGQALNEKEE
jgi:hypothetical protein